MGSSPHTRGAHDGRDAHLVELGIIPAYAGSTSYGFHRWIWSWDHPRIRGEHDWFALPSEVEVGSSPHTRGAQVGVLDADGGLGIIPAYAGSTRSRATSRASTRDHPRIRGEHAAQPLEVRWQRGSSPHTRGALGALNRCDNLRGIIPAYAGSTFLHDEYNVKGRDHPRIRGEHGREVQ